MTFWSPEKIEQLKQLATEKITRTEIAEKIETTERAVSAKLFALGLKTGNNNRGRHVQYTWDDDKSETLARLWLSNTSEAIAKILNCSRAAVWRQSRVLGLPKRCFGYVRTIQCVECNRSVESYTSLQKYCKECAPVVKNRTKKYQRVLNLTEPVWPQEKIDRMLSLRANGLSAASIGNILGVTRNSVIGKLGRLGIKSPTRNPRIKFSNGKPRRPSLPRVPRAPRPALPKLPRMVRFANNAPALDPLELTPIHLVQIKNGQCKFIEGDDHMMCGRKIIEGTSWCPHHYARTHILDRRSAPLASLNKQSMEDCTGQEHTESSLQEVDRRSPDRVGFAEGEVSFG